MALCKATDIARSTIRSGRSLDRMLLALSAFHLVLVVGWLAALKSESLQLAYFYALGALTVMTWLMLGIVITRRLGH